MENTLKELSITDLKAMEDFARHQSALQSSLRREQYWKNLLFRCSEELKKRAELILPFDANS